MNYFLITYNRRTGKPEVEEFEGMRRDAMAARFQLERKHRGNPDMEIVVLASDSRESVERTHPRYFRTVGQLASSGDL